VPLVITPVIGCGDAPDEPIDTLAALELELDQVPPGVVTYKFSVLPKLHIAIVLGVAPVPSLIAETAGLEFTVNTIGVLVAIAGDAQVLLEVNSQVIELLPNAKLPEVNV
jgi:hypothetical protein